jgi:hypothetical protein
MPGWAHQGSHKKHARTHCTELVLFHLVRSTGHVVHSNVIVAQNIDAPFFMLDWTRRGYTKKCVETHYAKVLFLHPVRSTCHRMCSGKSGARNIKSSTHYFSHMGGPIVDPIKGAS